jgi:hypothetical protein
MNKMGVMHGNKEVKSHNAKQKAIESKMHPQVIG